MWLCYLTCHWSPFSVRSHVTSQHWGRVGRHCWGGAAFPHFTLPDSFKFYFISGFSLSGNVLTLTSFASRCFGSDSATIKGEIPDYVKIGSQCTRNHFLLSGISPLIVAPSRSASSNHQWVEGQILSAFLHWDPKAAWVCLSPCINKMRSFSELHQGVRE